MSFEIITRSLTEEWHKLKNKALTKQSKFICNKSYSIHNCGESKFYCKHSQPHSQTKMCFVECGHHTDAMCVPWEAATLKLKFKVWMHKMLYGLWQV